VVDGDAVDVQGEFALSLEELREVHEATIPALLA
jgi:phosphoribosylformylglycinamidine synthase